MKKKYSLLLIFITISVANFCNAQPKTTTYIANGKTVTDTGPIPTENLSDTYTREYKDKKGILKEQTTWVKNAIGEWTYKHEILTAGGTVKERLEGKLEIRDGQFVVTQYKYTKFDKDLATSITTVEPGQDGKLHKTQVIMNPPKTIESIVDDHYMDRLNPMLTPPFQNNVSPPSSGTSLAPIDDVNCKRQLAILLGPSYLSRDFGDEKESLWGVNLVANYHITPNISAGIDVSTYSKKISDEKFNTSFYLADAEYLFGKKENHCSRPISVFARIAIGMMHERYASQKNSGMVYGAGAGSDFRLNDSFHFRIGFDYLFGKLEDENFNNFRVGVLASYIKTKK